MLGLLGEMLYRSYMTKPWELVYYNRDKYFVPRAGRRGKVQKVGEFTMAFEESPNMSEIVRVPDPYNPKKYIQKSVISRPCFMKRVIMDECALFDGVVVIMGPQNSVYHDNFFPSQMKEMSEVVVQGQWFMGCDSVVAVQWVSWVYPTSATGNETLTAGRTLAWKDLSLEVLQASYLR
ncbi:hypothetical protein Tco_1297038, partial [Tanacetum coccineum]